MKVEELERELRDERPEPELDFARRLDEWAAAGFPRDRGLGPRTAQRKGPLLRAWDRVTSVPPRRLLLPAAGAVATVVVVAGVVVNGANQDGGGLSAPPTREESSGDAGGGGDFATGSEPSALETQDAAQLPDSGAAETIAPVPPTDPGGGGIARGTDDRIIDATARLELGTEADEVQDVANDVVEVTDRHNGIVVSSQVTSDQAGARASFELEIPYRELDATLTDLSGLADVISRTEAGQDITARAVRARKDLADVLERIRRARVELIEADTHEERQVIRAEIASLKANAEALETELNSVVRQGRFATVSVGVTSNGPGDDDGNWSLGDALDDAGRVLEVIGGIGLIALAVLVPLALIAGLAAFATITARRRGRERALDA
jgi:Domain of unknown function (DUF4349)